MFAVLVCITIIVDDVKRLGFSQHKWGVIHSLFILGAFLFWCVKEPLWVLNNLPPQLFFLSFYGVCRFIVKYNLFRFKEWFEPVISRSEARIVDSSLLYVKEPIEIPDGLFRIYAVLRIVIVLEVIALSLVAQVGAELVEVGWL